MLTRDTPFWKFVAACSILPSRILRLESQIMGISPVLNPSASAAGSLR